jgi:hypothetical protein
MYFAVYRIMNKLNGKSYIGKHQTKKLDDGYFGSGKRLKDAIQHYGVETFTKEILFVFDNELDMNAKEKDLVNEDFLNSGQSYNLCEGGNGGFGYINASGIDKFHGKKHNHKTIDVIRQKARQRKASPRMMEMLNDNNPMRNPAFAAKQSAKLKGHKVSEETRQKIRESLLKRNTRV